MGLIFISYNGQDNPWMQRLMVHLKILEYSGRASLWHDGMLDPGDKLKAERAHAIERSKGAILLLSADYLADVQLMEEELPLLMEREQNGGIWLLPLVLRACSWQLVPQLTRLFLSENGIPIILANTSKIDRHFKSIVDKISTKLDPAKPQSTAPRSQKAVPASLLPYLLDRQIQEAVLRDDLFADNTRSRFIWLVHGSVGECHDKFLERLKHYFFPRMEDRNGGQAALKTIHFNWPRGLKDPRQFKNRVFADLADLYLGQPQCADVPQAINNSHNGSIMISTNVSCRTLGPQVRPLLDGFLNSWSNWPKAPAGRKLFFVLFITYGEEERSLFKSFFSPERKNNRLVRNALEELELEAHEGLLVPELQCVTQDEAGDWTRIPQVRKALGDDLMPIIRDIYKLEDLIKEDRISMQDLTAEIKARTMLLS